MGLLVGQVITSRGKGSAALGVVACMSRGKAAGGKAAGATSVGDVWSPTALSPGPRKEGIKEKLV